MWREVHKPPNVNDLVVRSILCREVVVKLFAKDEPGEPAPARAVFDDREAVVRVRSQHVADAGDRLRDVEDDGVHLHDLLDDLSVHRLGRRVGQEHDALEAQQHVVQRVAAKVPAQLGGRDGDGERGKPPEVARDLEDDDCHRHAQTTCAAPKGGRPNHRPYAGIDERVVVHRLVKLVDEHSKHAAQARANGHGRNDKPRRNGQAGRDEREQEIYKEERDEHAVREDVVASLDKEVADGRVPAHLEQRSELVVFAFGAAVCAEARLLEDCLDILGRECRIAQAGPELEGDAHVAVEISRGTRVADEVGGGRAWKRRRQKHSERRRNKHHGHRIGNLARGRRHVVAAKLVNPLGDQVKDGPENTAHNAEARKVDDVNGRMPLRTNEQETEGGEAAGVEARPLADEPEEIIRDGARNVCPENQLAVEERDGFLEHEQSATNWRPKGGRNAGGASACNEDALVPVVSQRLRPCLLLTERGHAVELAEIAHKAHSDHRPNVNHWTLWTKSKTRPDGACDADNLAPQRPEVHGTPGRSAVQKCKYFGDARPTRGRLVEDDAHSDKHKARHDERIHNPRNAKVLVLDVFAKKVKLRVREMLSDDVNGLVNARDNKTDGNEHGPAHDGLELDGPSCARLERLAVLLVVDDFIVETLRWSARVSPPHLVDHAPANVRHACVLAVRCPRQSQQLPGLSKRMHAAFRPVKEFSRDARERTHRMRRAMCSAYTAQPPLH
eukprot:Opistho-1_new@68946